MPATEKQVSREWHHSPDEVFAALVRVVDGGKYRLDVRNDAAHQVFFEKGSRWGWLHQFSADVVNSDGTSRLDVTVKSPPETIIGLANGLILQRAGDKLIKAVDATLTDSSSGPITPG